MEDLVASFTCFPDQLNNKLYDYHLTANDIITIQRSDNTVFLIVWYNRTSFLKEDSQNDTQQTKAQILGALARGYCSKKNENKVVDPVLIEAMAVEILKL